MTTETYKVCKVCPRLLPDIDNYCPNCGRPAEELTEEEADAWWNSLENGPKIESVDWRRRELYIAFALGNHFVLTLMRGIKPTKRLVSEGTVYAMNNTVERFGSDAGIGKVTLPEVVGIFEKILPSTQE